MRPESDPDHYLATQSDLNCVRQDNPTIWLSSYSRVSCTDGGQVRQQSCIGTAPMCRSPEGNIAILGWLRLLASPR